MQDTREQSRRFAPSRWVEAKCRLMQGGNYPVVTSRRKALMYVIEYIKEGIWDDEVTFDQALSAISAAQRLLGVTPPRGRKGT